MQPAIDPWAAYWARRYSWALKGRPYLSYEDLLQSAALGAFIAKDSYKEDCGSWAQYSSYFIRNELRHLIGIKQGRLPALTLSLDAPLTALGEDDDTTLLDTVADDSLPDMDDVVLDNEARQTVRDAVERLKDALQRQVIQMHRFEGKSITETAQALEITQNDVRRLDRQARFQHLARDRHVLALIHLEDHTPYYRGTGFKAFNTTWTSATENAAIWRIEHREQIQGDEDNVHTIDNDDQGTGAAFRQAWERDAASGAHALHNPPHDLEEARLQAAEALLPTE